MAYLVAFLMTAVFAVIYDNSVQRVNERAFCREALYFAVCIPVVTVSAVRYDVGTDYLSIYWRYYQTLAAGESLTGVDATIDKGLWLLNSMLIKISSNPVLFFTLSSLFIYLALFRYIKKTEENITLPVICFLASGLFFTSLNIVRQFIAMAIVLSGWSFLKKKRLLPYLLCCIVASFFHLSALIMIILFFLQYLRINRDRFVRLFGVAIVATPIIKAVFFFLINHTRYSYYLYNNLFVVDYDLAGTVYALLFTGLVFWRYEKCREQKAFFLWNGVLLCYDIVVCMSYVLPLCHRISIYFKFFLFVNLVPMIVKSFETKERKILVVALLVIFMSASTLYLYFVRGNADVFPYRSIFGI